MCYILNNLINNVLQVEGNFDPSEAAKCLYWIKTISNEEGIAENSEEIDSQHDSVYELLKDGMVLCRSDLLFFQSLFYIVYKILGLRSTDKQQFLLKQML